ncbi:hypothetical protein ACFZ8E_13110 [Methylobacterium sp. HMF5984]|uniref:hypothetical protein n=1 Tax=Methylobacterium sp. HMF5984 TaxID=3367370 RepID=UPI003854ABE6
MMRERVAIVDALERKGFKCRGGDHEYYIYHNLDGKKTMYKTKVSRGTSYKNIGDDLIGKMARQVGLNKKLFLELVDCTLDQKQYDAHINAQ